MMRVLILTFFYPPDLSAGSFRMGAFINQLMPRLPDGAKVDVITTKPNRYASFDIDSSENEIHNALTIERIPLPPHQNGIFDQVRAFVAFDRAVTRRVKSRNYDLIFATSSKLMTAFLGARIAHRKQIPLFLDIRDIFLDTMTDLFPGWKGRVMIPLISKIENYTIPKASKLNLVSGGFREYFDRRYPNIPTHFFTNGVDDQFLQEIWNQEQKDKKEPIKVLYAGNIGEGQGLHKILPELARLAGTRFKFVIVGDGGKKNLLIHSMKGIDGSEVEFMQPVKRGDLIQLYKDCDIFFIHLNNHSAFSKVLPSKLFEYAATGKPIFAGVGGYPAEFLNSHVENCQVFPPCDAQAGLKALESLTLGFTPRSQFIQKFARTKIMGEMADVLISMDIRSIGREL